MRNEKRLILLSDLWGKEKASWIDQYTTILKGHFDLQFYDSCELGDVSKSDYTQESLHQQFIDFGIDQSVQNLIQLEKKRLSVLAFSVGGVIAWNYALQTSLLDKLYCVSSTRLRYETQKPEGHIELYYGKLDQHQPAQEWFEKIGLDCIGFNQRGHDLYTEPSFANNLAEHIIRSH